MATDVPEIDGLFRLPLEEFTAARNALATRLKAAGRAEAAARVKDIPKPPLSAWTVNQLYWRHRKAFDELLDASDRLRRVQATSLRAAGSKGGGLRHAMEVRRAALAELTARVAGLLQTAGHAAAPEVARRITTTLDALATYGRQPGGPRPGRLTDDVAAPGLEALASLVNGGRARGAEPTRVIPFGQRDADRPEAAGSPAAEKRRRNRERKARAAAIRAAARTLAEARKTAARAEGVLKQAAARAKSAEQKKDAVSARLETLAAEAERARQEARRVAAQAEEAAQAVADAERALDDARRAREARE